MAQSGSAPALGAGGQRFESSHLDQLFLDVKTFNSISVDTFLTKPGLVW